MKLHSTRPAPFWTFVLASLLVSLHCYAPDYYTPQRVLEALQNIPLDGSMRETDMERTARQLLDRLEPQAPTDERIVRRVYRILSRDLMPEGAQPKSATDSQQMLLQTMGATDRAALVEWAGKQSQGSKEFLENLTDIVRRDKDAPSRMEAIHALSNAKWRPRDRTTPSPVVQALAEVNQRESNPYLRGIALRALVALHAPGSAYEADPHIATAIFPPSAQASDERLKEQLKALRELGLEKPHVRDVIKAQLDTTLGFVTPQTQNLPVYQLGKQRVSFLLEELRQATEKAAEPSQHLAIKSLWEPVLAELAGHPDLQIRMEALATQVRFDTRALGAVVENEKTFPEYPKMTARQLGSQMGKGIETLAKLVTQATGDSLLEGIKILGEFANEHPTASEELRRMAKSKQFKNNESVQLAISAALVSAMEASSDGPEIKNLVEAIVAKKPTHERLRESLKKAAATFQPYRTRLLDLQAAKPRDAALQDLLSEVLTAPETLANLRNGDERSVNYLLRRAEAEQGRGPHTAALESMSLDQLSKASQRKVAEFQQDCGRAAANLSEQ